MNLDEYYKSFNGLYFEMGIPARLKRDAISQEDYWTFINKFKGQNLYTTVYGLREPANYYSAVVDRIFLEFDGPGKTFNEELRQDFVKFLEYLNRNTDVVPQIFYSGNSGFHVVINFKPIELVNPSKCIQRVIANMKKLSGCEYLDLNANNGLSQMRRIPNSLNHKTKLYAIPLKMEEVMLMSCEDIMTLAKTPRDFWNASGLSRNIPEALGMVDHWLEKKVALRLLQGPSEAFLEHTGPCSCHIPILNGVEVGNRDIALVGLVYYCKSIGHNMDSAFEYLWLWHSTKNKEVKEDDKDWIKYKIRYHWNRNGKSCRWFKKAGYEFASDCSEGKPLQM